MRHSVEDLLASADEEESEFTKTFALTWGDERRRLILWWERGAVPPSGNGALDARWKAHWSAMTNTLKQRVSDLTPRVLVGGRPFVKRPDPGIAIRDLPSGIARQRGREGT